MASADLRAELECSVCSNVYTDPVTLNCGHNFCWECIDHVLDTQGLTGEYSCPECTEKFQGRPALCRNITLRNIVENFLPVRPNHEQFGVFCTYCIRTPVPAVKSCLMCEAALCDDHMRVHSKAPEHILCDPITSPGNRKCPVHKEILKYYCTEDSSCICVSCRLDGEHQGHQVETLKEASEKKKKELRNVLQKLMTKREKTEKRVQSLEEHRRKVQGQADDETERIAALFRDLKRGLEDLENRVLREVSEQAEQISNFVSEIIRELEIKKDKLFSNICHIEELCSMMDPLPVLLESDTGDLCGPEDGHDEDTHDDGGDLDVEEVLYALQTGLCNIITGVNVWERPDTHVSPHSSTEEEDPTTAEPTRPHRPPTPTAQHSFLQAGEANIRSVEQTGGLSHTLYTGLRDIMSEVIVQECPDTDDSSPSSTEDEDPPPDEPDIMPGVMIHSGKDDSSLSSKEDDSTTAHPLLWLTELWSFADILMDLSTANNWLEISNDRKKATKSDIHQNRPETPQRFNAPRQVLSAQSFSSGRHYWVVDVKKSDSWIAGMCYTSIERKGEQSQIGDNKKSWGVQRSWGSDQLSVIHNKKKIPLQGKVSSNRVGIFLNYEARQISFYDMCNPIQHLHTFTITFTEPLHAGVCVLRGEIIICGTG